MSCAGWPGRASWLRAGLLLALLNLGAAGARADEPPFARVRGLTLEAARQVALKRSGPLALAQAQVVYAKTTLAQQQSALAEQRKRFKVDTSGGLDPFAGRVRYYLSLDLERLLQLNSDTRNKARQQVTLAEQQITAEQIGSREAEAAAIRRVTAAWYALRTAEASATTAADNLETTKALHVAADARFRAGAGELSAVLASLKASRDAEDAITATKQATLLASLDLAQACGYRTAEEMEADLTGAKQPTKEAERAP